jgi:hypothetical protein
MNEALRITIEDASPAGKEISPQRARIDAA